MKPRICVVTAGHLSTCPRMLKAADALAEAGYRVRVVSTQQTDWAAEADLAVRRRRANLWRWTVVNYDRHTARGTYLRSGVRFRSAQRLARLLGAARCPIPLAARAFSRVHPELMRAALAEPEDLFYGGTSGTLAAVAEIARRSGVPYGLDLEDFHSAELVPSRASRLPIRLAERIERAVLPGASFLTTASAAIASAYSIGYGVHPITIHNTFPLPARAPDPAPRPGAGLRLYWFSQTIGPGRGLEDVMEAMGRARIPGELHLRGRAIPDYIGSLRRRAGELVPPLHVVHHEPASPDSMVDLCGDFDAGLAVEPGSSLNNRLSLSNKTFTYLLAGLAVVMTDTPGQRPLALQLGEGALLYAPGDVRALAAGLKRWAEDRSLLARARAAAWQSAKRRWHWEHPDERGALLGAVTRALLR